MGERLYELLEVKTEGEVLLVGSGEGTAGGVIPRGTLVVFPSPSPTITIDVYNYASIEIHQPLVGSTWDDGTVTLLNVTATSSGNTVTLS